MTQPIQDLVFRISAAIINPFLALVFGAAFLLFAWGVVQFLIELNVGGGEKNVAKSHMFWGLVGMFIMVAAYAIIRLIANTINVGLPGGY